MGTKNEGKGGFAIFDTIQNPSSNITSSEYFKLRLTQEDLPTYDYHMTTQLSNIQTKDCNLGYSVNSTSPLSWTLSFSDTETDIKKNAYIYVICQGIESTTHTWSEGTNNGFIIITRQPNNTTVNSDKDIWSYKYVTNAKNTIFQFDKFYNLYTASGVMNSESTGNILYFLYRPSNIPTIIGSYDSFQNIKMDDGSDFTSNQFNNNFNTKILGWSATPQTTYNTNKISFSEDNYPASVSLFENWGSTKKLPIFDMVIAKESKSLIISFFETVQSFSIRYSSSTENGVDIYLSANDNSSFDKGFNMIYLPSITGTDPGVNTNTILKQTHSLTVSAFGESTYYTAEWEPPPHSSGSQVFMSPSFAKSISTDNSFKTLSLSSNINSSLGYWNTWLTMNGSVPADITYNQNQYPKWSLTPTNAPTASIYHGVSSSSATTLAHNFIDLVTLNNKDVTFSIPITNLAGKDVNNILIISDSNGGDIDVVDSDINPPYLFG